MLQIGRILNRPTWRDIAYPWQLPPEGDWDVWLMLHGRGAGGTLAGAQAIHEYAQLPLDIEKDQLPHRWIGLYGPTLDYVRDVMVEGPSGLLSLPNPPAWTDRRKKSLTWPSGASGLIFSCISDSKGYRLHRSWAEGLWQWKDLEKLWSLLEFSTCLGTDPRVIASSVARPLSLFRRLAQDPRVAVTRGSTFDNEPNLTPRVQKLIATLGGTEMAKQELGGVILDMNGGPES